MAAERLEVEFPPLLEYKTQFDDFSNVEVLDANRLATARY